MPNSRETSQVLSSIMGNIEVVWSYQNGDWMVYDPNSFALSDLTVMTPGFGYWIKINTACTWTMP